MDAPRLLSMLHYDEYKDSNNSYIGTRINIKKRNELLIERDISLTTIHSTLPNYISHHLNYCLDHCTDRDLIKFIKWKSENDIKTFRLWMRIIASTITPQIEQENVMINEWYTHLLNINNNNNNNNNINNNQIIHDINNSENKDNETNNDSASEEEEHYSISTELDMSPNKLPITKNKKFINLDLDLTANIDEMTARYNKYRDCISVTSDKTDKTDKSDKTDNSSSTATTTTTNTTKTNNNNNILMIHRQKSQMTLSNLLDLPSSWLLHLFSHYFSFNTLLTKLPLVCHEFRTLCGDPNVWKSIKLSITTIRNIYNESLVSDKKEEEDNNNNNDDKKTKINKNNMNNMNYTAYFQSFLIRSCRLLQIITLEGSIEENDWNAWNHCMKILGLHSLRQIKWDKTGNIKPHCIDTLFVRCRHISRRGYCWLQSLSFIPSIEHIHCAALSRSDDVQHMIYNFNKLKTLNVNILGPRHPNRNFHSHHRLALKSISHLIPSTVTEFAIPVSVQEDFVRECFSRMPLLENLDFFRLTTPHQNVDIDSWACCLSSDTIYHLANNCKKLKKCQLFVKCFKPKTAIWDSVKFLLSNCKHIHMLTIGMTESETLNGLQKILPPSANNNNNNVDIEYDKLSKRYFDQLKKVPFLRKRFRKFKKKTMKFPKFTIMWCLLT